MGETVREEERQQSVVETVYREERAQKGTAVVQT